MLTGFSVLARFYAVAQVFDPSAKRNHSFTIATGCLVFFSLVALKHSNSPTMTTTAAIDSRTLAYFLGGCVLTRLSAAGLAKHAPPSTLPFMGGLALVPALGFLAVYNRRSSGPETFGQPIWWNRLRPVHALLWGAFAVAALTQKRNLWWLLLVDVLLGLAAFTIHHASTSPICCASEKAQ